MGRYTLVGNKQVVEPGVYPEILGQAPIPIVTDTFGNVMLIDTGLGAGYGGGAGINGALEQGLNSISQFSNLASFQAFIGGGLFWDLAQYLFSPGPGATGPTSLLFAVAATTTAPQLVLTFTISSVAYGAVTISCRVEGVPGNGTLDGTNSFPITGFSVTISAGIVNSSAFIMSFYRGTYKGLNPEGVPYDGIAANSTIPSLVAKSTEFTTTAQLIAWMQSDANFNSYFALTASTPGSGTLPAGLLTLYSGPQVFTGGTTTYGSTNVDSVLGVITDIEIDSFLCDDYGPTPTGISGQIASGVNQGALSAANNKILSFIVNQANYPGMDMYVGAGSITAEYNRPGTGDGTLQIAAYYNSANVNVIDSGPKLPSSFSNSAIPYVLRPSLYTAAMVCGLINGQTPQTPGTWKQVRVIGVQNQLTDTQRKTALLSGILHLKFVKKLGFVINQSINSLQNNAALVYANGTSPEISIMRIAHQLIKELKDGLIIFVGGNLATSSAADVHAYVQAYLTERSKGNGLIITFNTITVTLSSTAWYITFCFVPNGPINQLFPVGFMMDPTVFINQNQQQAAQVA